MPLLQWEDNFSVGHEGVDNQHKEWIRIINVLHDKLINDRDDDDLNSVTTEALLAVKLYGEKHFKYEEGLLAKSGYPELEYHKKLHDDFNQKINKMYYDHVSGDIILNSQLMKLLQNWLKDHILDEDKKFKTHLSK
mgnify:CR=1 FL=1